MKNLQVKRVPDEVHRRLRACAARRKQTIRDVVLEAVERELAYDALYLAPARLHDAPVLTADGPLARALTSGVVVENVRSTRPGL